MNDKHSHRFIIVPASFKKHKHGITQKFIDAERAKYKGKVTRLPPEFTPRNVKVALGNISWDEFEYTERSYSQFY